jgi:hypothetical protein
MGTARHRNPDEFKREALELLKRERPAVESDCRGAGDSGGAAARFLVAYDPVKKHGPRADADLRLVTLSW